jgi:hypothetical protein
LIPWGDEDGGRDPESLRQAADLSNVEFVLAGEDFWHNPLASDFRQLGLR